MLLLPDRRRGRGRGAAPWPLLTGHSDSSGARRPGLSGGTRVRCCRAYRCVVSSGGASCPRRAPARRARRVGGLTAWWPRSTRTSESSTTAVAPRRQATEGRPPRDFVPRRPREATSRGRTGRRPGADLVSVGAGTGLAPARPDPLPAHSGRFRIVPQAVVRDVILRGRQGSLLRHASKPRDPSPAARWRELTASLMRRA